MNYVILAIKLFIAYRAGGLLSAILLVVVFCNDNDLFRKFIMDYDTPTEERVAIFIKETGITKWLFRKWNIALSLVVLVLFELYF